MDYQKQWQFLKKTAERGRVPQAFLFSGPEKEKEKTLALEFIKLLNCQKENFSQRPCQKCQNCWEIEKKIHPDLFVVKPQESREIKINQIRELYSRLVLRSHSAFFKSVVIEQADRLNQEAQSAFLKLLEEPKGQTIFILISQYPEKLLSTLLSRVERLRFYSSLPPFSLKEKKVIERLIELRKKDLNSRFQYAQELAEASPDLREEILEIWLRYFREILLTSPYQTKNLRIVKLLQNLHYLISTTNLNPRLALEILMLEI